jgi:hypothetical protein
LTLASLPEAETKAVLHYFTRFFRTTFQGVGKEGRKERKKERKNERKHVKCSSLRVVCTTGI